MFSLLTNGDAIHSHITITPLGRGVSMYCNSTNFSANLSILAKDVGGKAEFCALDFFFFYKIKTLSAYHLRVMKKGPDGLELSINVNEHNFCVSHLSTDNFPIDQFVTRIMTLNMIMSDDSNARLEENFSYFNGLVVKLKNTMPIITRDEVKEGDAALEKCVEMLVDIEELFEEEVASLERIQTAPSA